MNNLLFLPIEFKPINRFLHALLNFLPVCWCLWHVLCKWNHDLTRCLLPTSICFPTEVVLLNNIIKRFLIQMKRNKHEIIFFIGTLKLHSKEKRSMRVEIQCVKDIFYFSTKGKLFFISSSLYLLLLSTFTEEFFCVVVTDISCFCICYCVACIKW